MGSQSGEVDWQRQRTRRMKVLCLLALVAFVKSSDELAEEVMNKINLYNCRVKCWGQANVDKYTAAQIASTEKCMQMEPSFDVEAALRPQSNPFTTLPQQINNPFKKLLTNNLSDLKSLWRNKRAAKSSGLLETDESDIIDFLQDFAHWGKTLASSIGNLTCVLQDLGYMTEDREVNIDSYLNFAEDESFDISLSYAKDPAFLKKMQDGYSDCYEISQSWPASSLNRNPLTKVFGRQHIFFKCAHKLETKLCAMGQMVEWLEKLYGKDPNEDPSDFGLPKDRYDAAAISIAVLDNAATPEEKFLDNFFWGDME